MPDDVLLQIAELGNPPWPTLDPFLFCVHHRDFYPAGNEVMGPSADTLRGRRIGMDFGGKDGWSMYHGDVVPGFPRHPHRGFETVTVARRGYIDHSDSLGATARFGHGDVQWMTAGSGVVHSEMFPLVRTDEDNPTELFQIWLNLPRANKMVPPHFTMLWSETIPTVELDEGVSARVIAGRLGDAGAPPPPPNSWASHADSDVAIWSLQLAPGARAVLPPAAKGSMRTLYFFEGHDMQLGSRGVDAGHLIVVNGEVDTPIENGSEASELLVLQGRPIGEPVVQHGPFVMNADGEIREAIMDYHRTGFGGWPWPSDGPVHPRERKRFAIHADGREEQPS